MITLKKGYQTKPWIPNSTGTKQLLRFCPLVNAALKTSNKLIQLISRVWLTRDSSLTFRIKSGKKRVF